MELDLTTLAVLAGIFVLAFLAETLTKYFASPFVKLIDSVVTNGRPLPTAMGISVLVERQRFIPEWALRYIAAVVGVLLAIAYRADALALFGLVAWTPWIGWIVTGLVIGRGSNYLHDLVDRWLAPVVRE